MSLLDGPLNVLGQRTTGESVRTQNGRLLLILWCGLSLWMFYKPAESELSF